MVAKTHEQGIDFTIRDTNERTPLHLAVATGNKDLVELVVQAMKTADLPGPIDRTPLHLAVVKSLPEIAQLLVSLEIT